MDKTTLDFYDKNAEKYLEWRSFQGPERAQEIFLQNVRTQGRILDVGCGTGNHSVWFAQKGFNVTAFDASKKMVGWLKQKNRVKCFQSDILDFNFDIGFDGIWCSFALQHLEKSNQNKFLEKIPKGLNKQGVFYLGIHEGSQEFRDKFGRYYAPRTQVEINSLFLKIGLSIFKTIKESSSSFDGSPIKVMHFFSTLKD